MLGLSSTRSGGVAFPHRAALERDAMAVVHEAVEDRMDSTAAYLKLATEDLRAVALEIPAAVLT